MTLDHFAAGRSRLGKIPPPAWGAGAIAALALVFAFFISAPAVILMIIAVCACFWAAREAQRYTISPRSQQGDIVGLGDLAPLL